LTEQQRTAWMRQDSDGRSLTPALLRASRSDEADRVLVYFREDSIGVGTDGWERYAQPVRLYGNVVHSPFETSEWKVACYLVVKAAGIIV